MQSQMESAEHKRTASAPNRLTPEQDRRSRERKHLELSRTAVLRDLATVTNPRYRDLLQASLDHLNERLTALESEEA